MKDSAVDETVIDRLRLALDTKALPTAAREYAIHLLNRLSQPVRVSVIGFPKSGKSELVNMFVGRRLVPKDAQLPTTEFVWGKTEAMTVTSASGSIVRSEHIDLDVVSGASAAFLRLEIPADILKRINLLEVVTDGGEQDVGSAIDWAVRRTDIALWCSQTFDDGEQKIWSRVPDSLKDHAFLVLTKADVLSAEKALSKRVADLESVVAEEFHSLFAVATLQAIRARNTQSDDGVDEAMFHGSGGGALTSEILRHAERGRRADFDSAQMFLARYQLPNTAKQKAANTPTPATEKPAISVPTAKAAEPIVPPHAEPATPRLQNVELFNDAVRYLKRRGDGLSETAGTLGEGNASEMVSQCIDMVEHLVDLFSGDATGCEAAENLVDELAEASDMMVLMQVEDGDGPAADAVTLLLQLRRDMEMRLAA